MESQGFLENLTSLQPQALISMAGRMALLVCIVILTLVLLKLVRAAMTKLLARQLPLPMFRLIQAAIKWVIIAGALMLVLQQFGVRVNSLWALLSTLLAMVAIGFVAVWSILSNLLCTVMLIIFHPFRIGDEIEIIDPAMTQGLSGRVRNINLIFTVLDTPDREEKEMTTLHIPNNLFFQKILRRRSGRQTHSLEKQIFEETSLLRKDAASGK